MPKSRTLSKVDAKKAGGVISYHGVNIKDHNKHAEDSTKISLTNKEEHGKHEKLPLEGVDHTHKKGTEHGVDLNQEKKSVDHESEKQPTEHGTDTDQTNENQTHQTHSTVLEPNHEHEESLVEHGSAGPKLTKIQEEHGVDKEHEKNSEISDAPKESLAIFLPKESVANVGSNRQSGLKVSSPEENEDGVIEPKHMDPVPRKSLQTLKEEKRISSLISVLSKSKENSLTANKTSKKRSNESRKSSTYPIPAEVRDGKGELLITAPPSVTNNELTSGSILSKTHKQKSGHVTMLNDYGEEYGEYGEWYYDEYEGEYEDYYAFDPKEFARMRSVASFANVNNKSSGEKNRELALEAYDKLKMKTFEDLVVSKAKRPVLLDSYCLGRGLIESLVDIVGPSDEEKSVVHDENILNYSAFQARIQELEEINSHSLQQIVLVFTGSTVSNRKTWSEDCNLIETAVSWMTRYLDTNCNVLFVRTGTHAEWKDPNNPFRTDKKLGIRSIPTIMVWNTEKRLAGNRLFNLDNLAVLLED